MSTRIVYRALLRASRNGRYPEVFTGKRVSQTIALPSNPKEVRLALRDEFQRERENAVSASRAMFDTLRQANVLTSILHPREQDLPSALPIFDFGSSSAIPGEELNFNFFEPRYIHLAKEAASCTNGMFILRAKPITDELTSNNTSLSVLMKIVEHSDLEGESIAVQCVAGPRLRVLQQIDVHVMNEAPPMKQATEFVLYNDNNNADNTDCDDRDGLPIMTRTRCLELLDTFVILELPSTFVKHGKLTTIGLPPLNLESFSFWALRFVLLDNDIATRHEWLLCVSTQRRLHYVTNLLEEFRRYKQEGNGVTQNLEK